MPDLHQISKIFLEVSSDVAKLHLIASVDFWQNSTQLGPTQPQLVFTLFLLMLPIINNGNNNKKVRD